MVCVPFKTFAYSDIKFMDIDLFIVLLYYFFGVYVISNDCPSFILDTGNV